MIEARIPRAQLRDAVETVTSMVAPPEAGDDGGWRAEMASRYPTVSGFVKVLTEAIAFEASPEGRRVLAAMTALPRALAHKPREHSATLVPIRLIDPQVVGRVWKRLVYGHPARKDGLADRNKYVFCVLEQFHRRLKRREIHAPASSRWRDLAKAPTTGRTSSAWSPPSTPARSARTTWCGCCSAMATPPRWARPSTPTAAWSSPCMCWR
ncbi:hypothetical protein GCM10018965_007870 [Nonomuraea roseola]